MKKTVARLVIVTAGFAVSGAMGLPQAASKAAGHWQGAIQMPNRDLGITVDLAKSPRGVWIGSITVVGSTAVDVPLGGISVKEGTVRFAAGLPEQTSFEGHLSGDASSVTGKVSSAAGEAPFQLTRNGEANVKVPPPSSRLTKEFEGAWEGTLDMGGKVKRIGLRLSSARDRTAIAALLTEVELRGADERMEIPVTTVTLKGKELNLEVRAVSGTYRGTLGAGGDIAGEWAQGPNRIPLTFKRVPSQAKKP